MRSKVARHSWCCHPPAVSREHDVKFSLLRTIQSAVKPRGSRVCSFGIFWLAVRGARMAFSIWHTGGFCWGTRLARD